MKKLFTIIILIVSIHSFGQDVQGTRVIARQSLFLRNTWVDSLRRDTIGWQNDFGSLPTAASVYKFVAGRMGGGGGTGTVTSVTGTANRITITGTPTVAPVVNIATTYVGQNSITTLGTITTGVWNGTAIANANLANSTISGVALGSNLFDLTTGYGVLYNSGTTYNGGAAKTILLDSATVFPQIRATISSSSNGGTTYTVAASNSPAVLKARADYICDGTADESEINTALALGNVILVEGTYNIAATIAVPDNTWLRGSGDGTILAVTTGIGVITDGGTTGIRISDLKITGNGAASQRGIYMTSVGSGTGPTAVTGCVIENIYITGTDLAGVELELCANSIVNNIRTTDIDFDGIVIDRSSVVAVSNGVHNGNFAGIFITGSTSTHINIINNIVEGSLDIGIQIENATDCIISGNVVRSSESFCLDIQNSARMTVDGNTLDGSNSQVVFNTSSVPNSVFSDNLITNGQLEGLIISSCENSTVSGNTIYNNGLATNNTYDAVSIFSDDVSFVGNTIKRGTGNQHRYGLRITLGSDRNLIADNKLYQSGATGDINNSSTLARIRDNVANDGTWLDLAITNYQFTMATNKLLGRGTAATGAIEEITLGTGLSLTGTTLNATVSVTTVGAINGGTEDANGANISGSTIYMQDADGTYPGLLSVAKYKNLFGHTTLSNPTGTITIDMSTYGQYLITQTSTGGRTLAVTNANPGTIFILDFDNTSGADIIYTLPANSFVNYVSSATATIPANKSSLSLSHYDGTNYWFTQSSSAVSGDVTKVGTPVNNQLGVWTGDGTIEGDANLTFASSTLNIGVAGSATGLLKLSGVTSGTVTIQPASAAGTYTLTLPTTDGGANEFLQTDGNGVLTWAAAGGGITVNSTAITSGATDAILFQNSSAQVSQGTFYYNETSKRLGIGIAPTYGFHVRTAGVAAIGSVAVLNLEGTAAYNAGAGAGIMFGGKWNAAGSYTPMANIFGGKDNVVDGDYGGALTFYTREFGGTTDNVAALRINSTQYANFAKRIYIGSTSTAPTALLHIVAGTATAGTAPLKLTTSTFNTTPEIGAIEFDGTNYTGSLAGTRYTFAKTLTATATLDFGSTVAGTSTDLTITLTGAVDGQSISLGVPNGSTLSNGIFTAWVSASNTVTVRFSNNSLAATLDPASGTFRASIIAY